jgi:hypothetical protein
MGTSPTKSDRNDWIAVPANNQSDGTKRTGSERIYFIGSHSETAFHVLQQGWYQCNRCL